MTALRRKHAEIDAARIEHLLAKKFAPPAFAFLPQLRNGTGFTKVVRTADAVAVSLWPSRGVYLHGFEIKVYRGDWLSELKNPEKAEEHAQFCHYWSIVAADGIVDPIELPGSWGLITATRDTLTVQRPAPVRLPKGLTLSFVAAMFRNTSERIPQLAKEYVHLDDLEKRVEEEAALLLEKRHNSAEVVSNQLNELRDRVKEFEAASGVEITRYGAERIGAAVKVVMTRGGAESLSAVRHSIDRAQSVLDRIRVDVEDAMRVDKASAVVEP